MKITHVCPKCDSVGIEVKDITVRNLVRQTNQIITNGINTWDACPNPECAVIYFHQDKYLADKEVAVKIWYKSNSEDVPICYCSNLTRGEITDAVKHGCKTIDEVQQYTNKDVTGNCLIANPLGKCCRDVFLSTIKKSSCHHPTNNDCCCRRNRDE